MFFFFIIDYCFKFFHPTVKNYLNINRDMKYQKNLSPVQKMNGLPIKILVAWIIVLLFKSIEKSSKRLEKRQKHFDFATFLDNFLEKEINLSKTRQIFLQFRMLSI